jgi:hypothetical protein
MLLAKGSKILIKYFKERENGVCVMDHYTGPVFKSGSCFKTDNGAN